MPYSALLSMVRSQTLRVSTEWNLLNDNKGHPLERLVNGLNITAARTIGWYTGAYKPLTKLGDANVLSRAHHQYAFYC
jgi:hypothetical protein